MEPFDYSHNIINYKGKKYPYRQIWLEEYNDYIILSVASLNDEVFGKKSCYENSLAEYIDNKIIFYVSDSEIFKPDSYLRTILKSILI